MPVWNLKWHEITCLYAQLACFTITLWQDLDWSSNPVTTALSKSTYLTPSERNTAVSLPGADSRKLIIPQLNDEQRGRLHQCTQEHCTHTNINAATMKLFKKSEELLSKGSDRRDLVRGCWVGNHCVWPLDIWRSKLSAAVVEFHLSQVNESLKLFINCYNTRYKNTKCFFIVFDICWFFLLSAFSKNCKDVTLSWMNAVSLHES